MKIIDKLVLHIKQFGVLKTFSDVIYRIAYVLFGWRTKVLFQLKYDINYQKHCNAVLNSGLEGKLSFEAEVVNNIIYKSSLYCLFHWISQKIGIVRSKESLQKS